MLWDKWMGLAAAYAKARSGCTKVQVGSIIVRGNQVLAMGANRTLPDMCKARGCLRVELYGDNSKDHRGPGDCRAVHSEIDAIASAGCDLTGATIYITRYPCEACARAIVAARITSVIYGRETQASPETYRIFDYGGVDVIHCRTYEEEDNVI